jgi:pimeloyl-ACP methyl ester carboxylesterase
MGNSTGGATRQRTIRVGDIDVNLLEAGPPDGYPLVMLHGINVQAHTWDPIAERLADQFHVLYPDLRGHGDSSWTKEGYGFRSFVEDFKGLVEELELEQFHFLGHSLGAVIAISYSGEYPERVSRLALSDAGPEVTREGALWVRGLVADILAHQTFNDEAEVRAFYEKWHPEWRAEFLDLHAKHQVRKNWVNKYVMKSDPELQWISRTAGRLPSAEVWESATHCTMPTLLMVGEHSKIVDKDLLDRMLSSMPNSTVRWFDTGHYIPREQPDEFTAVLRQFLSE